MKRKIFESEPAHLSAFISQILLALTEDNKLHLAEVLSVLRLVQSDIQPRRLISDIVSEVPSLGRQVLLSWADRVLVS